MSTGRLNLEPMSQQRGEEKLLEVGRLVSERERITRHRRTSYICIPLLVLTKLLNYHLAPITFHLTGDLIHPKTIGIVTVTIV